MNYIDAQILVSNILDRISKKEKVEDSRIELKSNFDEDHSNNARKTAAHANSASGREIFWIFGIDEINGLTEFQHTEFSSWVSKVRKYFDDVFPKYEYYNIQINSHTVVVILFNTQDSPYVVSNAKFGKEKTSISLEVPYREGSSTRTATRKDLLKILYPLYNKITVSVKFISITASVNDYDETKKYHTQFEVGTYLDKVYNKENPVILSPYSAKGKVFIEGNEYEVEHLYFRSASKHTIYDNNPDALVYGPGTFYINFSLRLNEKVNISEENFKDIFKFDLKINSLVDQLEFSIPKDITNITLNNKKNGSTLFEIVYRAPGF